jgi:formylglycine-generating enzyme required for sulfatase activity
MIQTLTKTMVVIVSSTVLATLTVNAVDMRGYFPDTLVAFLFGAATSHESEVCPAGMALVTQALTPFCVDVYEASPGPNCPFSNPQTVEETALNLATPTCGAQSVSQRVPWRQVTQHDAQQACSRAGKRLLKPDEWYKAALGTRDASQAFGEDGCNVSHNRADGAAPSGDGMRCVSDSGAYDMVGNVWEWVDAVVVHGVYEGVTLPLSGYVQGADLAGIAHVTGSAQDERFGGDRVWTDATIEAGMMRGGYYDSGGQSGLFSLYAASPQSFTGDAVGFRCGVTPLTH